MLNTMSNSAPHVLTPILFAMALAAGGCAELDDTAVDESIDSVVNGTPVIGHPTTGGLLRGTAAEEAFMQCSGTLIGCDTFITAAHCVCEDPQTCGQPIPPSQLFVYLQNSGTYPVSNVIIHPSYSFPSFGDVAIVRLAEPVIGITPTPIITAEQSLTAQMQIVGFGLTFNGENDSGIKREGVLRRSACNSFNNDTHMCFTPGNSPSVSCSGDSGGPSFIDIAGVTHLGAIVSGGGTQNSCTGGQKFATNVSGFVPFITQNSGALGGERCGVLPSAQDPTTVIATGEGVGGSGDFTIEVPAGTTELRVATNAIFSNVDLFVNFGAVARQEANLCQAEGRQTAFCEIKSPQPGTWHVNVLSGAPFQVAMTALGGGPTGEPDIYGAESGEVLDVGAGEGVLSNDVAGLGQALAAETVAQPANGIVNIQADGSFQYQANSDFAGMDTFTYRLREGEYFSQPVTVMVEVTEGGCFCSSSTPTGDTGLIFLIGLVLAARARRRRNR